MKKTKATGRRKKDIERGEESAEGGEGAGAKRGTQMLNLLLGVAGRQTRWD